MARLQGPLRPLCRGDCEVELPLGHALGQGAEIRVCRRYSLGFWRCFMRNTLEK